MDKLSPEQQSALEQWAADGATLNDIQQRLKTAFGISITYLDARMLRTYQTAFPNSPAVAPAAQMRQQLNLERARHGQLRDDDALSLLAVVAEALGSEVTDKLQAVHYADGLLDLGFPDMAADCLAPLQALLGARGLLVESKGEGSDRHLLVRPEALP